LENIPVGQTVLAFDLAPAMVYGYFLFVGSAGTPQVASIVKPGSSMLGN
jgi:hypothetical protein